MDTQELLQLSEQIETDPEWFISSDFEDSELAASLRELAALKCLIAELLDDPLILEGAPPGIGWFDRAEEAIGRPLGSSFQKAIAQKRKELSGVHETSHVRKELSDLEQNGHKPGCRYDHGECRCFAPLPHISGATDEAR